LAVAPAAGWIKMQFYIPYFTRVGMSLSHPFLNNLIEASIAEYDTDLYAPNLLGIPLLVRMGALGMFFFVQYFFQNEISFSIKGLFQLYLKMTMCLPFI
jgi:hypothetical protein